MQIELNSLWDVQRIQRSPNVHNEHRNNEASSLYVAQLTMRINAYTNSLHVSFCTWNNSATLIREFIVRTRATKKCLKNKAFTYHFATKHHGTDFQMTLRSLYSTRRIQPSDSIQTAQITERSLFFSCGNDTSTNAIVFCNFVRQ